MGFFSDIVKKVKKNPLSALASGAGALAAMPLGLPGMVGGAIVGGKVAKAGGLEDLLYGKKTKKAADDVAGMVKAGQTKGIGELNSALDVSGEGIVRNQAEASKTGILSAAQDARRNAQRVIAQRGLQNSSIGLAQNRTIDQTAGKDIAAVNANLPGAIRNQQIQDAQTRISQGGLGSPANIQWNTETNRGGGLLDIVGKLAPIAGTVAGGIAGGPAGAAMGSQMGSGLGQALQTTQPQGSGLFSPNKYSMGNYQF